MIHFVLVLLGVGIFVALLAAIFTAVPHAGPMGRRVSDFWSRAPWLDALVALLTWVPWLAGGLALGWWGVVAALLAQAGVLLGWIMIHEWIHAEAARGPRIVKFLNRQVGRGPNHAALWVTIVALPILWGVRLGEAVAYPPLVWLLGFPRYKHGDWVNLSRHKFDGLVGHDLIWCLYCDWMTGIYALAGEMLRNVESFWCPIRFDDAKKCENCKLDFPDIDGGWVRADGTMEQVEQLMEAKYGEGERTWFGHKARLTVEGHAIQWETPEDAQPPAADDDPEGPRE